VLTSAIADGTGDRLAGPLTSDFRTASGSSEDLTLRFMSQAVGGFTGDPMLVQVAAQTSLHGTSPAFNGQVTLKLNTWSFAPNNGAWTGPRELAAVAAVNGVATFANLTLPAPGHYRLEAFAAQVYPALSESFVTCVPECTVPISFFPAVRFNVGGGMVDGLIYVIGGYYAGWDYEVEYGVAAVEAYDPATRTWSTRAPMPTARYGVQAGVVNGILYAVGGFAFANGVASAVATVEAYDPASNTWTTRAPLPQPRSQVGIAVVDGIMYAVGGWGASGASTEVEAYDPATNAWTARASLPTPQPNAGTAAVGGLIYVAGGNGPLLSAYDPATDRWSVLPPTPFPFTTGNCAASHAGRLYVLSGGLAEYEPVSGTWTVQPDNYPPQCDGFMASNGSVLFLAGFDGVLWAYHQ
jgi:Kelch motif